jgi:tetratricopeptide (TPR) repeat protein
MSNAGNHKNNSSANRLGELLRQVRVPAKTDNEWQRLENDLFVRLDDETAPKHSRRFSFALPRFGIAWAAAAGLVLLIAGAGITIALLTNGASSSFAGLMSVRGSISVTWAGKGPAQTVSSLDNNAFGKALPGTVVSVPGNSSAIITLGRGSALELSPGTRLVVKKSTASQQVCFVSSGSVLVKVTKRASGQRFEVQTPCAACRVVGTVFKVEAFDGSKTALSVYQGKVMLLPSAGVQGSDTLVETGRQLTVSRTVGPVGRRLSGMSAPIHDISVLGMLAEQGSAETGVLDISSQPDGAMVLINGTMSGKTPFHAKMPRGAECSIAVYADGYSPWETRVTIGNDLVCSVHAPLSPVVSQPKAVPAAKKTAVLPVALRQQSEAELGLFPEYIAALVDISSGEYQRAIRIFDSLWNSGVVDIKGRMCLMEKVNTCYSKLGDFTKAAEALEDRYQKAETPQDKGQLLWQLATMRANCLGDYQGAEMALVEFLIVQPNALWAHSAYSKLAEIQYYLGKYESAAETYKKHIATFPDDPDIDRSMYNLACILGQDLNRCEKAAGWYSRLIDSFHASKYRAAAFFRRGECELQMGRPGEAQRDFKAYLSLSPDGIWRETCADNIKKYKGL